MKEKEELLKHNYDGIREFDNDLPVWWKVLFYLTIVFSFVYIGYIHLGYGQLSSQQLPAYLAEIENLKKQSSSGQEKNPVDEERKLISLLADSNVVEKGKLIFQAKCMACHGAKGEGLIGPNLTDDYWIHGEKATDIKKVIINGVLDKGMIAWGQQMSVDEIDQVTSFIWSIRGSNPPNSKAPQGIQSIR